LLEILRQQISDARQPSAGTNANSGESRARLYSQICLQWTRVTPRHSAMDFKRGKQDALTLNEREQV
jgi:hypothetical protein